MPDRPIIFSAPMVRALLAGTKTQTRRVLHPQPPRDYELVGMTGARAAFQAAVTYRPTEGDWDASIRLPCQSGDRLWVREAWRASHKLDRLNATMIAADCHDAGYLETWAPIQFEADGHRSNWAHDDRLGRYRAARFMPRWASRLTLLVTDVRVQRLHEISEADTIAEGVSIQQFGWHSSVPTDGAHEHIGSYAALWEHLHGPGSWDANPWVAAITFRVLPDNIDKLT